MRFSIAHLLLIVPAWVIAFQIAPYTFPWPRVSWRHDGVANEIRGIRLSANNETLSELEHRHSELTDAWGNKYQFVGRNEPGLFGSNSSIHVYSLGKDGITKSNGNDLDDINSWDYDRGDYYGPLVNREYNQRINVQALWQTIWICPITYVLMLPFLSWILRIQRNRRITM